MKKDKGKISGMTEKIQVKNKKILKRIVIILTIIILIIDICLYIKMKFDLSEIGSNHHQYENAGLIIGALFRYAALIWGILLIPILWLEYLLINLLIKMYNKFKDWKRVVLCSITLIVITIILILFIRIMALIVMTLVQYQSHGNTHSLHRVIRDVI